MSYVHNTWGPLTVTLGVLALIGAGTMFGKAFDTGSWLADRYTILWAPLRIRRRFPRPGALAVLPGGRPAKILRLYRDDDSAVIMAVVQPQYRDDDPDDLDLTPRWVPVSRLSDPAGTSAALATGPRWSRQPSPGGQS